MMAKACAAVVWGQGFPYFYSSLNCCTKSILHNKKASNKKFMCYTYKRHGINFVLENLQLYTHTRTALNLPFHIKQS